MKIVNRYTGKTIHECECYTVKECLLNALESGANLWGANLQYAKLQDADLQGANLWRADLHGADLQYAKLQDADLQGANLQYAKLQDADLQGANLWRANLQGALNAPESVADATSICPDGELVVYKKLREGVAVLSIPSDAKRSNATGRKCRSSKAIVIELPEGVEVGHSQHDPSFEYRAGATVEPKEPFCEDRWNECASGIHFFITRGEAERWTC
jgi:hypothetical protein